MRLIERRTSWLAAAAIAASLAGSVPAHACSPSGDLWFVSKNSDRVLVVDVESIRRSLPNSILRFAARAVGEAGRVAEAIEPGLGDVLVDHLPSLDPSEEVFVATVWIEGRITPEGWVPIGRRAEIKGSSWAGMQVPGFRAVLFQENRLGGVVWSTLPLAGSTLPVRGDEDLDQFVEVVSAAQRLPAGTPPSSWTQLALSYPSTRIFTRIRDATFERLAPALLESPSGVFADLKLLRAMRHVEDRRLDELAGSWVESARQAGDERLASCAAEVALVRFGLEEDDGREYWGCRGEEMLERWDRLDVEISSMDTSSLREAIESRRAFYESMTRSLAEAGF